MKDRSASSDWHLVSTSPATLVAEDEEKSGGMMAEKGLFGNLDH